MFDPTVYENLKVVLEGAVYDLDLAGAILVTAREDLVNLASLSRTFRMSFQLRKLEEEQGEGGLEGGTGLPLGSVPAVKAEVALSTELADLAGELLELADASPGCSLDIAFRLELPDLARAASAAAILEPALRQVWGDRFRFRHTHSYEHAVDGGTPGSVLCRIQVLLGRRFNEEVAEDLPRLVDHAVLSLEELERVLASF